MKLLDSLRNIYHFLGRIHFALILITAVALFVIAGTLIESITNSHRFAARFTYGSPVFSFLLWGFFVNILFSALQRWPFKRKHIPFLITHLGLLMILGGVIIKNYLGTQGSMGVLEGSSSQEIFIPDTYVIEIEKKGNSFKRQIELTPAFFGKIVGKFQDIQKYFPELSIKLWDYAPHSSEKFETWIKGSKGYVAGVMPFDVIEGMDIDEESPLPIVSTTRIAPHPIPWNILAFRSENIEELAKRAYLQDLNVNIQDYAANKSIFKGRLEQVLNTPLIWNDSRAVFHLVFDYTPLLGFIEPRLVIDISHLKNPLKIEQISIALSGPDSLINKNVLTPYLGSPSIAVDLNRKPVLAFIQDLQNDVHLFAFDAHGQVHSEPFRPDNLNSLIVYNGGFEGY